MDTEKANMYHDDECDEFAKGQRGSQIGFLKVGLYFVIIHNDKMLNVKGYKKKVGVAILVSHQTNFQAKKKKKYYGNKEDHYLKILFQKDMLMTKSIFSNKILKYRRKK